MTRLEFRRGQTFEAAYTFSVTLSDVVVTDLTGFTGAARVKFEGADPVDLTGGFAWVNPALRTAVVTAGATGDWPLGAARLDVQLTAPSGAKIDAPSVELNIKKGFNDD